MRPLRNKRRIIKIGKVVNRQELRVILDDLRGKGKKIVFTNGCFDLIHIGHVRYLQQARDCGDYLVVGVNSDDSIRTIKGEKRPFLRENERTRILASFECVDYVIVFNELDSRNIISFVRPDILVKGGDYGVDGIVGREIVWEYGGEVKNLGVVKGLSTTAVIEKILKMNKKVK